MKDKEIYPGKIMYSGFNGTVKPLQFVRHDENEADIYYARICYRGESGVEFGGEYKLIGLKYLFHTREEAIKFALSELSASIAKLPSIDELRDLEMSAQSEEKRLYLAIIAKMALEKSNNLAKWIAIDKSGLVYAYDNKPALSFSNYWRVSSSDENSWDVTKVPRPVDFTKELHNISEILAE